MNIELYIERLVLDGLPVQSHQGALIQSAVEAELERLLTGDGLMPELLSGGAIGSLRAGGVQLEQDFNAPRLGARIAGAVHRRIAADSGGAPKTRK
ncbi:MAG: hypothetical protein J2P21_12325 [Chloracidobacterium sp.]|nr:hypothetical protein [Chloracidobacterium sp.]